MEKENYLITNCMKDLTQTSVFVRFAILTASKEVKNFLNTFDFAFIKLGVGALLTTAILKASIS